MQTIPNPSKVRLLQWLCALLLVTAVQARAQGTTRYVYDDLGQLITAIDGSGNQITYTYDLGGNLVKVARGTAPATGALAILAFAPEVGAPGTVVTISGQNFSVTPASNTVTFNGAQAAVLSASTTTLTAAVPGTATTGLVAVTVNGVTATSTDSFTVVASPVVTAVSPALAFSGAAATTLSSFIVTGANLTGATFSFSPVFSPASVTVSAATVNAAGTSATLTLSVAGGVKGSFNVQAVNAVGSSSLVASAANTLRILDLDSDADGDGVTNVVEGAIGSDPLNATTSGSGIPDGWLVYFGFNPVTASGSTLDPVKSGNTLLQDFQLGLSPRNANRVAPSVTQVIPAAGATNVFVNTSVILRFGEALNTGVTLAQAQTAIAAALGTSTSVTASSKATAATTLQSYLNRTVLGTSVVAGSVVVAGPNGPVAGTVGPSNDGLSITFSPAVFLTSNTTYTITASGLRDAAGNLMTKSFTSSFTTGSAADYTPLSIALVDPENNSVNVPTNVHYSVQFNKPIDPSSLSPSTFQITDSVTLANVAGTVQVDASGLTAAFIPSVSLPLDRTFSSSFSTQIKDTVGNNLAAAAGYNFTTGYQDETAAPHWVASSPVNNSAGVAVNANINVQFSQPVELTTLASGIQLQANGAAVAVQMALSNGDQRVTLTPVSGLQPNTQYVVTVGGNITNLAGIALDNAGSFTFQTGTAVDKTSLTLLSIDPADQTAGAPLNVKIRAAFNKGVDATSVAGNITLYPASTGAAGSVAGSAAVSSDAQTIAFTPAANLVPETAYCVAIASILDLEGQALGNAGQACFTTGTTAQTVGPTVVAVNPPDGSPAVPVNAVIGIQLSEPVSIASVSAGAIMLTASGKAVSGTVSVPNPTTLIFTPAGSLAVNTRYTVATGSYTDLAGNAAVAFSSGFTTGSSATSDTSPGTLLSLVPASGATNVPVSTSVVATFSKPVNPLTVPGTSFALTVNGQETAVSFAVSGAVVTATPLSALPGNATVSVSISGVQDLSGNAFSPAVSGFTTAATADKTAPQIVMVTPGNGATGIGLSGQVVVLFSKSMNPATLTSTSVGLLAGGSSLPFKLTTSADNLSVVLSGLSLPANTVVKLTLSGAVTDLGGNALAAFTSQFTTTAAFDTSSPVVVSQRPANGATGVGIAASPLVLFVSKPLNSASVQNAFHVAQNGVLIAGTIAGVGNGQTFEFTPAAPFSYGAAVQVILDNTATDLSGNAATIYQGSFTTTGDPASAAPGLVNISPANKDTGVPLNAIIDALFSGALNASGLPSGVVLSTSAGAVVAASATLNATATIVHIVPQAPLAANTAYCVTFRGLQGVNGTAAVNASSCFTTGSTTQTTAPTLLAVSPQNGLTNVPLNARIGLSFSSPIDTVTVTAATVLLSGGGQTLVPANIAFGNGNRNVEITPEAPLPATTVMTIALKGVTDSSGNAIAASTTTFTTGTAPATSAFGIVTANPYANETGAPLHGAISLQSNALLDATTVNATAFQVVDGVTGSQQSGTYSASADGTTAYFLPAAALQMSHAYMVTFASPGLTDLAGNAVSTTCPGCLSSYTFTTGSTVAAAPQVIGVSPAAGLVKVPLNAQLAVAFNEPVDGASLAGVTLTANGQAVALTPSLANGNQLLTLTPATLIKNTIYTLTVANVSDATGNVMSGTFTSTFTTGSASDASPLSVNAVDPAAGTTGVPLNVKVRAGFSKGVNLVSLGGNNLELYPSASGTLTPVEGTITLAADGSSATLTPLTNLLAETQYCVAVTGVLDLEGQLQTQPVTGCFTTGATTQTSGRAGGLAVVSVSPANGASGVPVNATVSVSVNVAISTVSAGNALTVTANGQAVAGTVTVSNPTTLLFTPTANFSPSTAYTVSASGFTDLAGNAATAFSSSFTTGSAPADDTQGSVLSVTPADASAGVAVNTAVVVTFSKPVNSISIGSGTVRLSVAAHQIAATYQVNGTIVTVTPVSQLPPNATIQVGVSNVQDLAGNSFYGSSTAFTTASTPDTSAPSVVMVTPAGGATGIGPNGQVVVVFSKSMNPTTLTANNIALLAGGSLLSFTTNVSADNRTLVLTSLSLPASATITLALTNGIADLSGNSLPNFSSQFTTGSAQDALAATVVSQRPGNGAGSVSIAARPVVLFLSKPLNASTVAGALHVLQNGLPVTGTASLPGNGQTVTFTPAATWSYGALVQVILDQTAADLSGNAVTPYTGTFSVAPNPAVITPALTGSSPANNATGVPLNAVMDLRFSGPLDPSTIIAANFSLYAGHAISASVALDSTGTIVHVVPASALIATTGAVLSFQNLKGANGTSLVSQYISFSTGSAAQTATPVVVTVSPADKLTNVPVNARIGLSFNVPVDALTVTGNSVALSAGGQTLIPASIAFSNGGQTVEITPEAPLPAASAVTITVSGVTDLAGHAVTPFSSSFTTSNALAVAVPGVVLTNPVDTETNVPVNTALSLQANTQIDGTSLTAASFRVVDNTLTSPLAGAYTLSADSRTVYFVPTAQLATERSYSVAFDGGGLTDVAGNPITSSCAGCLSNFSFTTDFLRSTAAPQVKAVSPAAGLQQVPINALLTVAFNEPVNGESLSGITLIANGAGAATSTPLGFALGSGNQQLTMAPLAALLPNTSYTLTIAGVADEGGNVMSTPFTSTFKTAGGPDLRTFTLLAEDPSATATGVPLNVKVRFGFNKAVNAVSLGSGDLILYPTAAGAASTVVASTAFSTDGTAVTLSPQTNLLADTQYCVSVGSIVDLEGSTLSNPGVACFTTGTGIQTSGPSVVSVSPPQGAQGVAVNAIVEVSLSVPISAVSALGNGIVLSANGQPVAGTIVALDAMTLSFTPAGSLVAGATYTVSAGGFTDLAGDAASSFTSSFTTDPAGAADTTPGSVLTISPADGSSNVAVTTSIAVTFSKPVNPLSIIPANLAVMANGSEVAGTYAVNGSSAVFTPLSPLPGGASIVVREVNALDLAGNTFSGASATFTTASTRDTQAPTVTLVTPANGAAQIGLNGQVVVLFSKSMNPATLTSSDIALLAGGKELPFTVNTSFDNRTLTLSGLSLPPSTVITLAISGGVADLSGNALGSFTSTFLTASAFDATSAAVVNQRPANGASAVSLAASPLVLFLNKPLNSATVPSALHVTQNGLLVEGTVAVTGNGQTLQFTPSSAFSYGALIQVFLDATAQDLSGNAVMPYSGSFTTISDPSAATPVLVTSSPAAQASGLPLNLVLDQVFSGKLDPSTVNASNVIIYVGNGVVVPAAVTLDATATTLHVVPTSALSPSSHYLLSLTGLKGANGTSVLSYYLNFVTGTAAQTAAPTVTLVSPANQSTGVPLNARIGLQFSAPIDPVTVTSTTVAITDGGQTLVPASISFSGNGQLVEIVPEAPLLASTTATISVNGVTDLAGNVVTPFTSTFTTGTGAVSASGVIATSPVDGETAVPLNTVISLQTNSAIDPTTLNASTFTLTDSVLGQVGGSYSLSPDGRTLYFVPATLLAAGRSYSVAFTSTALTDLAGDAMTASCAGCLGNFSFTTGFGLSASAPAVTGVSPAGGSQQVPINAQLIVYFNEPVNDGSLGATTLSTNGKQVAIAAALASGNQQMLVTPLAGLAANSAYTLTVAGVTDLSGKAMSSAFTSSFTTGATADPRPFTVLAIDPAQSTLGVPLNAKVRLAFNKVVNASSFGGAVRLSAFTNNGSETLSSTAALSTDGLSASVTPAASLLPETRYCVDIDHVVDLEGEPLTAFATTCFTTGIATQTTGPNVVLVTPANSSSSVAVNALIELALNEAISAVSLSSNSITLMANGQQVPGMVGMTGASTLTFTPAALLASGTTYTLTATGFTDLAGNAVTPFSSSFTTASTSTADTTPGSILSTSPADGATNVSVTSSIAVTFPKPVNALTVGSSTFVVRVNSAQVAGSYSVSGPVATFTPVSALPGGASVQLNVNGVQDLSGNVFPGASTSFTTAATPDTTAPTVVMVTPAAGTLGVGLNGQVMVLFSKSMNPITLIPGNIALLSGGSTISTAISVSADNRTLVLSSLSLPGSSLITLALSNAITDLSGNALASFTSQFTTAAALNVSSATVVTQRPGNGATGVAITASPIVLFLSRPVDAGSVPGAIHIVQNGQLVSGTTVVGNGQTVEFTPQTSWTYGAQVQIFLDATASDLSGSPITAYTGSFTVTTDPATLVPTLVNVSPLPGATGVPFNVIPSASFSTPIDPTTLTPTTVRLQTLSTLAPSTVTPNATGNGFTLVPASPLAADTKYYFVFNGFLGVNGKAYAQGFGLPTFTTGTSSLTVAPTVTVVSPADKLSAVPLNASVGLQFSAPIDPNTVSTSTVTLSGGGQTLIPGSISYSNANQTLEITPQAPLPSSTVMTLKVNGVTDLAGNAVTSFTSTFTTGTAPVTIAPGIVATNPSAGASNVPTNVAISLRASDTLNGTTISASSFQVYDTVLAVAVAGTYSLSSDGITVHFVPSAPLATGRTYNINFIGDGITDLAGNVLDPNCAGCLSNFSFTTGSGANASAPQVVGVSPASGQIGVPIDAQIVTAFNEPVDAATLAGVALVANGSDVASTTSLSGGNQLLTIEPVSGFNPNTAYTLTVAGVTDLAGNIMTAPFNSTLTTGGAVALSQPAVVSSSPAADATAVPLSAGITVNFNKSMNALSITTSSFTVTSAGSVAVAGTIAVNQPGTSAVFTPTTPLVPLTLYTVTITSGTVDLEGQPATALTYGFTTAGQ